MGKSFRIVFMGTPEFAVESLKSIHNSNHTIVGVVTAPDKPAGRGNKIQFSDVKKYALENNLGSILQPEKLKDQEFIDALSSLKADLFIVVAFRMLPEVVWAMPEFGTINLHASLLPQYRGAAPINWAIINGETITGISTFFIEKEIDTGHILMQQPVKIFTKDNAGTLHDKLMVEGGKLMLETIERIAQGNIQALPQHEIRSETILKPAPKIFKDDCRIKWDVPSLQIHNHIRGLSPYPCAWTELHGLDGEVIPMKIFETEILKEETNGFRPGTIVYTPNKGLKVACIDGFINILSLQLAGKSRVDARSFMLGFKGTDNFTLLT
jgi:methionyl-tRNA formyltransferase